MDKPALVGDVIQTWLAQRSQNRPTLCYGVNRAHAEHLQQRFIEAGVTAEYIDCFTDRADRERIFDRFREGATRVICNVGVLTTGIDLDVRCIIDAKPTKSEILFVQTIGRGLRAAEGKDHLLILDHGGNHLRLGLVTDIHHEHLGRRRAAHNPPEGRQRTEVSQLPRLCQDCQAVMPLSARVCPECGKVREVRTEIEHVDGELVELGAKSTKRSAAHAIAEQEGDFYGELRWMASVRGYASGWAAHKFRERFGVWPNDWQVRTAAPREPSLKTKNWLRSRQIAFAKRRAA